MKSGISILTGLILTMALFFAGGSPLQAAEYKIDPAHSFVEFRVQHIGYSWLYGRFNDVSGNFSYDGTKAGESKFTVEIASDSVDTNHAERDKHLRSKDFLDVGKFPKATFVSKSFAGNDEGGVIEGVLTLHGVSKTIKIDVEKVGEGKDPWGGYRAGFTGKTSLKKSDFGISYNLGPASEKIFFDLSVEGIRK